MADAHVPLRDAEAARDPFTLPGEHDPGLAAGFGDDLDVGPRDAAAPASTQHLQHGFLGRESTGQMLEITLVVPLAVALLCGGEHAIKEPVAVFLDALTY